MINTCEELQGLKPEDFDTVILTQEEILRWLTITEAGWMHSGDPKMPHAELASGMCSNGFFFAESCCDSRT